MKHKRKTKPLWVAVKVERGYICEAKIYDSFDSAKRTEQRWQSRLNPDYDEAAVLRGKVITNRRNQKRLH
jgi:hypothetical protein